MRQPIKRTMATPSATPHTTPASPIATTYATPSSQHLAAPAPRPSDVIAVDHSDGLLKPTVSTGEFQKAPTAPQSIEAMNTKAFPPPQTKWSDNDYLNQLFKSLERSLAARNKQDTAQLATQIIQSTESTSVASLPEAAIKLFISAANFGFVVDTSRTVEVKSDVIKRAEADRVLEDLFGDDEDFLSM